MALTLLLKDGKLVLDAGSLVVTQNAADCECCDPVDLGCCDGITLPGTLYVRATGRDGCECIMEDFEITNPDPTTSLTWTGFQDSCDASGDQWQLSISCTGGTWTASQSACRVGLGEATMTVTSCDPFAATFSLEKDATPAGYCCGGWVDFEISETPFP